MKASRIFILLLVFAAWMPATAQRHASIAFNAPSSYIGLWETIPSMAILTVTTELGTPATRARFFLTLIHESHGTVATGESGVKDLNAGPSVQTFLSHEITRWHDLDYSRSRVDPVRASGRLPEGEYTAQVEIRDLDGETLAETEETFYIVYADPPLLLTPINGEEPTSPNPTFMWTPVLLPGGYTVTYRLRIVELLEGQEPERAIELNIPYYDDEITGTEVYPYPAYGLPFEEDITYVWQIQAVDELGNPAARNDGKSPIFTFFYGEEGAVSDEFEITVLPETFFVTHVDQPIDLNFTLRDPRSVVSGDPVEMTHIRYNWADNGSTWGETGTWEAFTTPIVIQPGTSELRTQRIVFDAALRSRLLRGATPGSFTLQVDFQGHIGEEEAQLYTGPFVRVNIAEEGAEFAVDVIYPALLPVVFSPESPRHAIHFEFDGTGHSEIHVNGIQFVAYYPYDGHRRDQGTDPISVTIPAGGTATHEWGLEMSVHFMIDLVLDAPETRAALGYTPSAVDLIAEINFTGEEGGAPVSGHVEIPVSVRREAATTFDVRVDSPDGIPLVWHPGAESHPLNFELDATGHSEIEITSKRRFEYIPLLDREREMARESFGPARIPSGSIYRDEGGRIMTAEMQDRMYLLNDEIVEANGGVNPTEVEFEYRVVYEGIERPEDDPDGFPVTGRVTVPMVVREGRGSETSRTFPLRIVSGAELPLIYHPGAISHTISLELDATGLLELTVDESENVIYIPSTESYYIQEMVRHSDLYVGENSVLTHPWELSIPEAQQADILAADTPESPRSELSGEFQILIICLEDGRIVRRGTVTVPIIVRTAEAEAMATSDLTITSSVSELTFYAGETSKTVDFELSSGFSEDVTIDTSMITLERDGRVVSSVIERITLALAAGGTTEIEEHTFTIDRDEALGDEESVRCDLVATFKGSKSGGERVAGRLTIPTTVTTEAAGSPAERTGEEFVLIPDVAVVIPTTETTITSGSTVLNGRGILKILPSPFDSLEVDVSFTALTFETDSDGDVECTGGRLDAFAEGSENLFNLYGSLFQARRISFDAVRDEDELLKIDEANIDLPGREPLIIRNAIINEDGISLEDINLEYSMFGLTLRITDIESGEEDGKSKLTMTVFLRLQGRDRSEEFASTELTITEGGGIKGVVEPEPEPYPIIRGQEYLMLSEVEFKIHPDSSESYVGLTVALNYPSPLEDLGPSEFMLKIGFDGTITGEVALITEDEDDDLDSDVTKLEFGSFATFDLTYVAVQLTGSGDGFDDEHSYVALSGDFIIHRDESEDYTINFGDNEDEPGVRINFDGSVEWHDLMLATDERINMGPIYVKFRTFGFEFSPEFKFVLSGGLGVNKEDVFSGEIMLETLKIDRHGNVDFDGMVVRGGSLSIMEMVSIGVEDFDFCDGDDCEIEFKAASGKTSKDTTIAVTSYFQMEGASINIGEEGSGGSGGFEELLLFEKDGDNNFVLRQANIDIADQIEIKLDFRYLEGHPVWGDIVSLAGSVKIEKQPSPITASVYGKIGEKPDGSCTWGLFVAVGGLGINIGPVTLDQLGGGFFYNPIIEDLALVREMCDIERPDIADKIEGVDRPEGAGYPGSFAAMIFAGVYVGSPDIIEGRCLLTITERNISLDAAISALDGIAEGAFYLGVGWDPSYLEGIIQLEVDLYSIIGAEAYLMFYVYGEDIWAVMGEAEIQVIPALPLITIGAEFFVGPPGFLLDVNFDIGFDIGILSAHAGFECMYWYSVGVSWGAYIKIYAEGEILWGLVGIGGSLEGALIGIEGEGLLVYCVGSFHVELFWITVFDGSIWMTLDGDGLDGGEGRNSKYDQLIEDARNMADQMRSDMEDIADAMDEINGTLETLGEIELEAAGLALIRGLGGMSSYSLRERYERDAEYSVLHVPESARNTLLAVKTDIFQHEAIGNNVRALEAMESNKRNLSAYAEFFANQHEAVTEELQDLGDLLTGELPTINDLPSLTNPVGAARYETIEIEGRSITVKADVEFNEETASEITDQVGQQQQDIEEYQEMLFQLIGEYEHNLEALNEFMGPSKEPVEAPVTETTPHDYSPNELSRMYGNTYTQLQYYFERYLDLAHYGPQQFAALADELESRRADIEAALRAQADGLTGTQAHNLANNRREFINLLLEMADEEPRAADGWPSPDDDAGWRDECVDRGMDVWYRIPKTGFIVYGTGLAAQKSVALEIVQTARSAYLSDWTSYTNGLQRVHDRRARLHELLYDLYDQLSISATRYPPVDVMTAMAPVSMFLLGSGGEEEEPEGEASDLVFMRPAVSTLPSSGGTSTSAPATGDYLAPSAVGLLSPYEDSPRGYFSRKRDQMTRTLIPPRINAFTGNASSANPYYAHVNMNWDVEHPVGIADISYRLVKPAVSTGGDFIVFWTFSSDLPWRTVGPWAAGTTFSAFDSLDAPGDYQIYLRAMGAGGYSVTRQGHVDVGFASDSGSPFVSELDSDDETPPTRPVVDDSVDVTYNTEQLYASWHASDSQSGIAAYNYRVVERRTSGGRISKDGRYMEMPTSSHSPVTDWTSAAAMQALYVRDLHLEHNKTYCVEVKAQNGVGLWSEIGRSDGVTVDTTAASMPTITSFILGEYHDVLNAMCTAPLPLSEGDAATTTSTFTTSTGLIFAMGGLPPAETSSPGSITDVPAMMTMAASPAGVITADSGPYANSLSARWSEAFDEESGVIGYYYAIGNSPSSTSILSWTFTEVRQTTVENLPISQDDSCYFRVRAVNGTGKLGPIANRLLVIEYEDTTPPVRAPYVQASYDMETDSLVLYWYGDGGDPESGVTEYQWAIGIHSEEEEPSTLVRVWQSTGQQRRVETTVELTMGRRYFIKVRAINGVGLYQTGYREVSIPWRTMRVRSFGP